MTALGELATPSRGPRVLVVDDERMVADLIVDILVLDHYQVDRATNGREALARILTQEYEVIVTDVHMPDLDGPAFFEELSRVAPQAARRVLFITGDALSPETHRFLEGTGLPYLEKPFGLNQLQAAVRGFLRAG